MPRRIVILAVPIFILAWFFVLGRTAKAADAVITQDTVWSKGEVRVIDGGDGLMVMPGVKLTVEAGVIIKLAPNNAILVRGELEIQGSPSEPVVITSIKDDSAGGDTNGDGAATSPTPGDWYGLVANDPTAKIKIDYAKISYGGGYFDNESFLFMVNQAAEFSLSHAKVVNNQGFISIGQPAVFRMNYSNIYNPDFCLNHDPFGMGVALTYCGGPFIFYSGAAGLDAANNYWGHEAGPTLFEQMSGPEDIKGTPIANNINYQPFLTSPWTAEPPQPPQPDPVILVPGILGSYLYSSIDPGVEIWPAVGKIIVDPWDLHLNQMVMDGQGRPSDNSMIVPPQDIIRSILNKDYFSGLIEELRQNGYVEGNNLFVFPYDWRLDLNWTANGIPYSGFDSLKDKIEKIKLQTGAEKVNIIAHSMGGLVVKNYLKRYGGGSINKFIDIATPHLGAPKAFKILMFGDDMNFNFLGLGLNSERVKLISQNFPSVYQLLPGRNYFDSPEPGAGYYVYDMHDLDNNGVTGRLNYEQSIDLMKNTGRNDYLLGFNGALHDDLDNYSPTSAGIKTYNLIGCGQPTIGQIFVLNQEASGGAEYGLKYVSGDGTVPLASAEALAADDNFYLRGAEHAVMPSADGIKQIAAAVLNDTIGSLALQNYPQISRAGAGCSLNGTQISFHSPIELNVYDENGNHVGPKANGDIELGIAGAQYDDLDGNKFVFLPAGHDYRIAGQATAGGSFNARAQTVQNGQYIETVYYNQVPLKSASTVAQMQINNGQPAGAIELDQNGDQIFETLVEPSAVLTQAEAADLIKPETQINISGTAGDNGYYISTTTITLIAADDQSGSGILKIEYSLDGGRSWQNYDSLVILISDGQYNLLYKSTDRAGNVEAEKAQNIKIDKTAPFVNILLPLEAQKFTRDEFFTPEYEIADNYSGVASTSLAILLDGQPIDQLRQDLFYYSLGEHVLNVTVSDLAGNRSQASVKFIVGADLDSAIADVNRAYGLGWVSNEKVKFWLNQKLSEIRKYMEKFGARQTKLERKKEKIMAQCLKKKNQVWCEKKLGKYYDKAVYKLNKIHKKIIAKRYQEILKKLDNYYKKRWLNQSAYDIVKEDIGYLINNL